MLYHANIQNLKSFIFDITIYIYVLYINVLVYLENFYRFLVFNLVQVYPNLADLFINKKYNIEIYEILDFDNDNESDNDESNNDESDNESDYDNDNELVEPDTYKLVKLRLYWNLTDDELSLEGLPEKFIFHITINGEYLIVGVDKEKGLYHIFNRCHGITFNSIILYTQNKQD